MARSIKRKLSEAFGFGGLAVALLSPLLLAAAPRFAEGVQEKDSGRTRVALFRVEIGESERVLQWELELDEKGIPTSAPIRPVVITPEGRSEPSFIETGFFLAYDVEATRDPRVLKLRFLLDPKQPIEVRPTEGGYAALLGERERKVILDEVQVEKDGSRFIPDIVSIRYSGRSLKSGELAYGTYYER